MSSAAQVDFTKSSSRRQRNARTLRAYMALRNQEIAQRIKELREARGNPPQPIVATAVGVSLRTYQNWEGGDAKPEYRNLESLAAYFGVSEEFILTGLERKPVQVNGDTPDLFAGQPQDLQEQLDRIEDKVDDNRRAINLIMLKLGINLPAAVRAGAPVPDRIPELPETSEAQRRGA